jgi:hypothetical protein
MIHGWDWVFAVIYMIAFMTIIMKWLVGYVIDIG